ncbi:hypothetical protein FOA52_003901 [Chlamydomonas sp. UWO 241]|nr:hypothetical protein FOA52_003901 [Chlamydomonas sp. UWO 241]
MVSPVGASELEEPGCQSHFSPRAAARGDGFLYTLARASFVTGVVLLALEAAMFVVLLQGGHSEATCCEVPAWAQQVTPMHACELTDYYQAAALSDAGDLTVDASAGGMRGMTASAADMVAWVMRAAEDARIAATTTPAAYPLLAATTSEPADAPLPSTSVEAPVAASVEEESHEGEAAASAGDAAPPAAAAASAAPLRAPAASLLSAALRMLSGMTLELAVRCSAGAFIAACVLAVLLLAHPPSSLVGGTPRGTPRVTPRGTPRAAGTGPSRRTTPRRSAPPASAPRSTPRGAGLFSPLLSARPSPVGAATDGWDLVGAEDFDDGLQMPEVVMRSLHSGGATAPTQAEAGTFDLSPFPTRRAATADSTPDLTPLTAPPTASKPNGRPSLSPFALLGSGSFLPLQKTAVKKLPTPSSGVRSGGPSRSPSLTPGLIDGQRHALLLASADGEDQEGAATEEGGSPQSPGSVQGVGATVAALIGSAQKALVGSAQRVLARSARKDASPLGGMAEEEGADDDTRTARQQDQDQSSAVEVAASAAADDEAAKAAFATRRRTRHSTIGL